MKQGHESSEVSHGFRRLVTARKIGESGALQDVTATANELVQIAVFLGLEEISDLSCRMTLSRWRAKGIKLKGSLMATVVQTCVVTLEPVRNAVSAKFERRFLPPDMLEGEHSQHEVLIDPEGEDPPEPMMNEIDLGEVVVEELTLNLDPYPRSQGPAFAAAVGDTDSDREKEREKPFAALAKLKQKLEGKP